MNMGTYCLIITTLRLFETPDARAPRAYQNGATMCDVREECAGRVGYGEEMKPVAAGCFGSWIRPNTRPYTDSGRHFPDTPD